MKPQSLLRIHRVIALVFAPLLLVQALTGAMLVFRGPLAQAIAPATMLRQSDPALGTRPPEAIVAAAAHALPGWRMTRLFLPDQPSGVALASFATPRGAVRYATFDPGDGRLLASGSVWHFPVEAAARLHFELLSGPVGALVVLANGVALLVLTLAGAAHWWPGRGRIMAALKIRPRLAPRLRLRAWHRSAGAVACIAIGFSATTGMILAATDLDFSSLAPAAAVQRAPDPAEVGAALRLLGASRPERPIRDIRFGADGALAINLFAPAAGPRALDQIRIAPSPAGPAIAKVLPATANPAPWLTWLPLHAGDTFGLAGRALLLIEALAILFLAVSGPVQWWQGRSNRRRTYQ